MTTEAFDKFTGTRDFMMKKIAIADNFHSLKLFEGDFAVMQLADTVWNAAKADSEQEIAELTEKLEAMTDSCKLNHRLAGEWIEKNNELQAHINRLLKHIKEDIYQPDNSSSLTRSGNSYCTDCGSLIGDGHLPKCILFTTPAQSLKAHDDVLIERCAKECEYAATPYRDADKFYICAEAVRALKGE